MNKMSLSNTFTNPLIEMILTRARECGLKIYIVGGSVRDILIGETVFSDIDMVYDGDFDSFREVLFSEVPFKRLVFSKKGFLTERFCFRKVMVDFQPIEGGNLERDAYHRDFTINALFLELTETGEFSVYDYVDGLSDLEKRRIRCVSDTVFSDDPLRILRLFRMAVSHEFVYTDEELRVAKEHVARLSLVARERMRSEVEKIFPETPLYILRDMHSIGVDIALFGFEIDFTRYTPMKTLRNCVYRLFATHGAGTTLAEWGKAMTFSTRDCVAWHTIHEIDVFPDSRSEIEYYQYFHARPITVLTAAYDYFVEIGSALQIARLDRIIRHHVRCVDGNRIKEEFHVEGHALGKVSDALHCVQIRIDESNPDAVLKRYREGLDF